MENYKGAHQDARPLPKTHRYIVSATSRPQLTPGAEPVTVLRYCSSQKAAEGHVESLRRAGFDAVIR